MAFSKTNFVDSQTVIDAATLNAIQDELIRVGGLLGKDIQSATINDSGHLILTLTDGTTLDAGVAKGAQGEKGATGPAGPAGPAGAPGKDGAAGADGVTPHIGDNGNWYLGDEDTGVAAKGVKGDTGPQGPKGGDGAKGDTGPQGPKGATGATGPAGIVISSTQPTGDTHPVWLNPDGDADGEDFSLGISSATVGQIAKIAAVDDKGVPTAWEPVDMPDGEKAWVLVADTVTEEDAVGAQLLTWNKDIAGNTFSYSELIVKVTPKYADNNSHDIIVALPNNKNYWLFDSVLQNNTLGIMHFKIILSEGLGLVRGEWAKNPDKNGGAKATVNLWVSTRSEFFIPFPTSVQIALRDSPMAGSKIQVYVR